MKRNILKTISIFLLVFFPLSIFADSFMKVKYIGGMPGFDKKAKGSLEITNKNIIFKAKNGKFSFKIPLKDVNYVATGEEVKHRWKLGLILGITLTPLAGLVALAKKHEENIGIEFKNEKEKTAGFPVFIVKKGQAKTIKSLIEVRTGKKFENKNETKGTSTNKKSK